MQLSAYRIVAELGSGGMGKVYRAEVVARAAGLERGTAVALKVIHPHLLETPGFFKRFLREAQIGQQVRHDNVVRTFDCDATLVDGASQHFLVMEYVEGQTLRELLQELERVPEELCRHVGCEIAKGLAAIHDAGVIHRDIKPENVLITEEHVVKVMDLGGAHLQDEAMRLSHTGSFVGSLEYAAPEQFMSGGEEADGRADLHALGLVLYELATGQHPYRDEDAKKVLRNVLDASPRRAGEVNPQLSPFFEEVVHKLLAKQREDRFATAAELADVLDAGEASEWWKQRTKVLRIETKQPLRRVRVPRETALYGRGEDLAKLHALFVEAKAGDGQVVLVEGEAGIGKTRLVDEFVGRLRQNGEEINFLFGSYPPGGAATASGAFSTAYREQFGGAMLQQTLSEYLVETPLLIPAFAALLRGDAAPTGAEPLTKDSIQTVFVHATRGLAHERTTVVLIDDLHFAPEEGRALFASLALAAPGHRILLVGTMRPGLPEEWTANLERHDHAARMGLSRLGAKDLTSLLKDAFRSEQLAEELGFRIAEKSDGNPFFAFEIIRGLREGQFITQEADGAWVRTQVIQDIQIPSSVIDLIQARLRDLSEEERELVDVASCCGFEFDPSLVADVVEMRRIPALRAFGRIENRHRLVRSAGQMLVFDHHQVQESLYEGMLEQLKAEYHAEIAQALEAREAAADTDPKELDGDLCDDLCEHFLKGAQGQKALRYLDAALDHLEAGYLNDQSIALADRALEVKGLLQGKVRLNVLLKKNARLGLLGRREARQAVLSEARTLAEEDGEPASLGKIDHATGVFLWHTGRNEEALPYFERARAFCVDLGDRTGEAGATNAMANVLHWLCRYEEALAEHERALAIYRATGNRSGVALVTGNLGLVLKDQGCFEEARAHYERALVINKEIGNRDREATNMVNLGALCMEQGRNEEARTHYERSLAISKEMGHRQGEARDTGALGLCFKDQGRSAEALSHLERALAIWREIGNRQGEAVSTGNLGGLLLSLGLTKESLAHQKRALALAREIGDLRVQGYWLHELGAVSKQAGDFVRAHSFFKEALSLRREIGYPSGVAATLSSLGDLLLDQGRGEQAVPFLEEALSLVKEKGMPRTEVVVLCRLALLPDGDTQTALETLTAKQDQLGPPEQRSARFLLFRATKDEAHLVEAKHLLDYLVEHAPEDCRESMLKNVRVNRDIMKAWAEQEAAS